MWFSRSFTAGLGIHLVVILPIACMAGIPEHDWVAPSEAAERRWNGVWLYFLAIPLWWQHARLRKQRREMDIGLWMMSVGFTILFIGHFMYVKAAVEVPLEKSTGHWGHAILPFVYPGYLLVVSLIGLARAWQLRPGPPGLPLPREW